MIKYIDYVCPHTGILAKLEKEDIDLCKNFLDAHKIIINIHHDEKTNERYNTKRSSIMIRRFIQIDKISI